MQFSSNASTNGHVYPGITRFCHSHTRINKVFICEVDRGIFILKEYDLG